MGASFIHDAKVQEIKIPMAHNCSERLITLWNGRTPDSKDIRTGYPRSLEHPIVMSPFQDFPICGFWVLQKVKTLHYAT